MRTYIISYGNRHRSVTDVPCASLGRTAATIPAVKIPLGTVLNPSPPSLLFFFAV